MAKYIVDTPFERAIVFAARAHAGLLDRTGTEGQILHALRVEKNVRKLTNDENVWAIALLHDTVEDTGTTMATIEAEFGTTIAEGVAAVTRAYFLRSAVGAPQVRYEPPPAEQVCDCKTPKCMQPAHRYAKEKYRHFIERAKRHPLGRLVKIADILDNMTPERVAGLPESEREMVTTRYQPALEFLRSAATEFFTPKQLARVCKYCGHTFAEHRSPKRECPAAVGLFSETHTFKGVRP